MWEAIHALAYFGHDVVIVKEGSEVVLFQDVGGYVLDRDADVLELGRGCSEVEVLDVGEWSIVQWLQVLILTDVGSNPAGKLFTPQKLSIHIPNPSLPPSLRRRLCANVPIKG